LVEITRGRTNLTRTDIGQETFIMLADFGESSPRLP
jgi:hypothetical protein